MSKIWPNTQLTFQTVVRNNGVLATPTTITFQWKLYRDGAWQTATPAALSTGVYAAYITPTYGGPLYWMWTTTGPAVSEAGVTMIECSPFDNTGYGWLYDYGWGPVGGYW